MADTYYVLTAGDDGIRVATLTRDEFIKRITPGPNGDRYYGGDGPLRFTDDPTAVSDGYGANPETTIMVIVGKVIIPKPIDVVTRYEVP